MSKAKTSRGRIIHDPRYDTDYVIGYFDGQPVVVSDKRDMFARIPEGRGIYNCGEQYVWLVEDGEWVFTHISNFSWHTPPSACMHPDELDWDWELEMEWEE